MRRKKGLQRRAGREDSLALAVKQRKADLMARGVPEEERCGYTLGEERCPGRKVRAQAKYCDLHEVWGRTELAMSGAPIPLSPMEMQVFLAKAVDQVISGQKSDVQVRAVLMLVKLMERNAYWIWQR